MPPILIPSIIYTQICIGLFHAGIGWQTWRNTGVYDEQTLFLLSLGVATYTIQKRLTSIPLERRSLSLIFEHAVAMGVIAWIFHTPWGQLWENTLIGFVGMSIIGALLTLVWESQTQTRLGGGDLGIPESLWKLGSLLTLLNTIILPLLLIFLHQNLATVWILYGVNWVFLWKEEDTIDSPSPA